jgi:hypothetical protein
MTNHSPNHLPSYIDSNNVIRAFYIAQDTNAVDFNKLGNAVCMKHATPSLLVNGQHHLVTLPIATTGSPINMKLNNKNEVIALVEGRFIRWQSTGAMSKSKPFKHIRGLSEATNLWILGFNSAGQILVGYDTKLAKKKFSLLTPKKR